MVCQFCWAVRQDMADASSESLSEYYDIVSKVFGCEAEGFRFYNKYALEKGFSVRKTYVEWDKSNQEICLRKLVCSREGFREAKYMNREDRKRRPRDVSRVGCKAKMVIAQDNESGHWYVKDFIEHNHPLAPKDLSCLLRSHRRISDEQKADIVEMKIAGIRKHQIMDIMEMQYGGYDKEEEYLAKKAEQERAEKTNSASDDIVDVTMEVDANKTNHCTKAKRKRGRPRKNLNPADSTKEQFSTNTIAKRVQSTNRRVSNPGRHQLSPYNYDLS
ncbi:hypothetical protein U9M48_020321 [Paspalum notatum var. saurae]|uniref:FAR1 domain-containing protein n=1 Tax=Paspalum notatum var. saurae TaxID=547442 RepID=A0AAQ3TFV4_PASNO